jgi:U4/U6.U5 tri-snRNP-associated protein 2
MQADFPVVHHARLQVSPHEFMQAVMSSSQRRFTIEQQSDPVEFWSWLLNTLHFALTGGLVC